MAWRSAKSLQRLRTQLNLRYPNRSRVSDGFIGDTAHQAQGANSDHNPWFSINGVGVVTAFDITHDPKNGVNIDRLSDVLAASRDPRIKYIIANSKILFGNDWPNAWKWQHYNGDPHTSHLHLSVNSASYDDDRPWDLNTGGEDMANPELVDLAFQTGFNRQATAAEIKEFSDKPVKLLLQHILKYNLDFRTKAAQFDNVQKALKESDAKVDKLSQGVGPMLDKAITYLESLK